jgi:hypothetical protein
MAVNPRLTGELARLVARTPSTVQHVAAALAESGGWFGSADALAHAVGLPHRDALYLALRDAHVPPLTEMAALVRALNWSLEIQDGATLAQLAAREAREPAQFRHHVRRWLGVPWSAFARLGPRWVVERIAERIGAA